MNFVVPKEWKTSTIKPLLKLAVAENLKSVETYTLLSALSKITEKPVNIKLS